MKTLKTLIRLQRRTLNELRKQLGAYERQRAVLVQASIKLAQDLHNEIELATNLPEMGSFFGNFSRRIQDRQDFLSAEVKKIDIEAEKVRQQMMEAFSETKKYEIALENWTKAQAAEAGRKETIAFDDIGLQQFRKSGEEALP